MIAKSEERAATPFRGVRVAGVRPFLYDGPINCLEPGILGFEKLPHSSQFLCQRRLLLKTLENKPCRYPQKVAGFSADIGITRAILKYNQLEVTLPVNCLKVIVVLCPEFSAGIMTFWVEPEGELSFDLLQQTLEVFRPIFPRRVNGEIIVEPPLGQKLFCGFDTLADEIVEEIRRQILKSKRYQKASGLAGCGKMAPEANGHVTTGTKDSAHAVQRIIRSLTEIVTNQSCVAHRGSLFFHNLLDIASDWCRSLCRGPNRGSGPRVIYPLAYVAHLASCSGAADMLSAYGGDIASLSRAFRLSAENLKQSEIESVFRADILQYEYGVLLISPVNTIEIHRDTDIKYPPGPEPHLEQQADFFQLVAMPEVAVMQQFSLRVLDAELTDVLEKLGVWSMLVQPALISVVVATLAFLSFFLGFFLFTWISQENCTSLWSCSHLRWSYLANWGIAVILVYLAITVIISILQYCGKTQRYRTLNRCRDIYITGEASLRRVTEAYQRALSMTELSISVSSKQSTLDSMSTSVLGLTIGVLTILVAVLVALH